MNDQIPIIDISALVNNSEGKQNVAKEISKALRIYGFFYVVGHGVDEKLQKKLELVSKQFFSLPLENKMKIKMIEGGSAWRGYFPLKNELTSGKPDLKEGIYFGEELDKESFLVRRRTPLHGRNLFPNEIVEYRETILEYLKIMESLSQKILEGIALSLGLEGKLLLRTIHKTSINFNGNIQLSGW